MAGSRSSTVDASKPTPRRRAVARQVAPPRRRHGIYKAAAGGGLVVAVIAALVLAGLFGGSGSSKPALAEGAYHLSANTVSKVEGVPVGAMARNAGTASASAVTAPRELPPNAPRLSSDGHPEIMYIGAQFCLLCVGERWALVMALSKFGTFHNLTGTTSAASGGHSSPPTFSFYGATYTSKYLSFATDEEKPTVIKTSAGHYESVQTLTKEEHDIITDWDVPPYATQSGSIPFVYMAGKFVLTNVQYDSTAIWKMNFQTAAAVMTSGKTTVSRQVEAAAGYLAADFCALTHDQPASVCSPLTRG
jgi:hypothetical protein